MKQCVSFGFFEGNPEDTFPGCRWVSSGWAQFPVGFVFPPGTTLHKSRGIATGHGRLSAGELIEPRSVDISGGVLVSPRCIKLADSTEIETYDGDGGVYGPSWITRES